jgi:hypothetical protein
MLWHRKFMAFIHRAPHERINHTDQTRADRRKKTTLPELGTQEKNPQNLNPINPAGLIN